MKHAKLFFIFLFALGLASSCSAMKKFTAPPALRFDLSKPESINLFPLLNKDRIIHMEFYPNQQNLYLLTRGPARSLIPRTSFFFDPSSAKKSKKIHTTYYQKDGCENFQYTENPEEEIKKLHYKLYQNYLKKKPVLRLPCPCNEKTFLHCEANKIILTIESTPKTIYTSKTLVHFLMWHPNDNMFMFANDNHLIFFDLKKNIETRFPTKKITRIKNIIFNENNTHHFLALCVERKKFDFDNEIIYFKMGNIKKATHEDFFYPSKLMVYDHGRQPVFSWKPPYIWVSNFVNLCPYLLGWKMKPHVPFGKKLCDCFVKTTT